MLKSLIMSLGKELLYHAVVNQKPQNGVEMKKKIYISVCLFILLCISLILFFLPEQKSEIINRYSYPGKTEKCRVLEFDKWNKGVIIIAQEIPDFTQYCIDNNLKFKEIKSAIIPCSIKEPDKLILLEKAAHIKPFPLYLHSSTELKAEAWYSEKNKTLYIASDILFYSR